MVYPTPSQSMKVMPSPGFVRNTPQNIIRTPATVVGAGSTGLMTVANDGVQMITRLPQSALQFTGTAFRTGESLVNGGTRLMFATGNSIFRSGVNTIGGGGRILLSTAALPFRLADNTFQRLRDMF